MMKIEIKNRINRATLFFAMISIVLCSAIESRAQTGVLAGDDIQLLIDLDENVGELYPMWAYLGYDEGNYTYLPDGIKLLKDFADISKEPVYVRAHNLLNTHDGSPMSLKWGSTNVYTEDENGKPVYDWKLIDKIVDTWINLGMKPLMEIGFMPKVLSSKPEPYRHHWTPGDPYSDIWTGWAYPPNDYDKWEELIYQWVRHSVERYGQTEVESWWWQLWNEPDAGYWAGTNEEYFKLYDYTAHAVKRALPTARVGGPNVTGGLSKRQGDFFNEFLEHCRSGKNHITGRIGTPLDFIGFHAKGNPRIEEEGYVQMNLSLHLRQIEAAFKIIKSFPEFNKLPIVIGESDPEGCAACSTHSGYAHMAYRNGTMFSSYMASSMARKYELADKYGVNLVGAVSWTFTFPGQPWFSGFRSFATNGINKPVFNVMRMLGMMKGNRVSVKGDHQFSVEKIMEDGVYNEVDISAVASRNKHGASALIWNYHDNDLKTASKTVTFSMKGVPAQRVLLTHYRIDEYHSNSYTAWREMGAPQQVTDAQFKTLKESSELQVLTSPKWVNVNDGEVIEQFELPHQAVSFFTIEWE